MYVVVVVVAFAGFVAPVGVTGALESWSLLQGKVEVKRGEVTPGTDRACQGGCCIVSPG